MIRPTKPSDIPWIADQMRSADVAELQASCGLGPKYALLHSFLISKPCMTMVSRTGEPLAMGGVAPDELNDRVGRIWLLGTNAMVEDSTNKTGFLRNCRSWVAAMHREYDLLWNCMDARNAVHQKWLEWMGFTFIAKRPNYGTEGRLFLEFCKVNHV